MLFFLLFCAPEPKNASDFSAVETHYKLVTSKALSFILELFLPGGMFRVHHLDSVTLFLKMIVFLKIYLIFFQAPPHS